MKQIILIHTVQTMYLKFEKRLREALDEEVKIDNILDTYFSSNPNEIGRFSTSNLNRLYLTLKSAELSNPVCIPVVCSSLSPYVSKLEELFNVPILQIDKRLGEETLKKGKNICILASAPSAVNATKLLIEKEAKKQQQEINLSSLHDIKAFEAMMQGNMKQHDEFMLDLSKKIKDQDVIVFAQGSIEHMKKQVENIASIPVVTAPQLLIEDIKEVVNRSRQDYV